jgi:hypothetical protein
MKAERIKFKFNRQRGDAALIKTWTEFDSAQQSLMLKGVKLDPDEVPVVGISEGRGRVAITTKRIIWHFGGVPHSLDLRNVAKVSVPESCESSKLDLHRLWLVTREGDEYLVETEPEPFFVLWNLLLSIIGEPLPVDR